MKDVFTTNAPAGIGPYTQAKVVGNMVYTSGQIAIVPATGNLAEGGIEAQAKQVCENLKAVLAEAGAPTLQRSLRPPASSRISTILQRSTRFTASISPLSPHVPA